MQDREYQQRAIKYLCSTFRGILKAPAGSGKTHVAASALSQCLAKRKDRAAVEIMVNTREQVDQMETACARFDVAARCDLQIYCAAGAPIGTKPDLIIVDECHHCSATTWVTKVQSCNGGRWGLSATPFDDKSPEQVELIKYVFTNRIHEIQRAELVDNGHLSKARVLIKDARCDGISDKIEELASKLIEKRRRKMPYMFRNEESERKQVNQCRWSACQKIGLWGNESRDYAIISEANTRVSEGKHVIVLIGSIDHGERLVQAIPSAKLCHSGMGAKKRKQAVADFRSGVLRCAVASSMLEEGSDFPIADCLIIAGAGRSFRKTVQSTGRVLRPHESKESGLIIDFKDSFHPMLRRQADARMKVYRELNYKFIDE